MVNQYELSQHNETDPLKMVIIGRHEGYRTNEAYVEVVNESQKKGLPSEPELKPEFEAFAKVLEDHGVQVLIPEYVGEFVYDQLTPRDIGIAIGHKFVIANMVKRSRRYEVAGIFPYLNQATGPEPPILIPSGKDMLLEGGDIIIQNEHIYAGISQRTNRQGIDFLQRHFGKHFEVVPVQCRSLEEGEDILHLDCTFNPVGSHHALIYPNGFREIPASIKENFMWIEVSYEEQQMLSVNVLSLDEKTVIARDHPKCERVNGEMEKAGLTVIRLPFDGAPRTGGSFRCCSLPVVRS
jgi:N-dimethylarginine dimethylaminohydrolase